MKIKPSTALAAAAWASLLTLTWLLALGLIVSASGKLAAAIWLFFFVVAAVASAVASPSKSDASETDPYRLDSHNRVTLPEGTVRELGLKSGDVVAFVRTGRGRWEVRTESAVVEEVSDLDE